MALFSRCAVCPRGQTAHRPVAPLSGVGESAMLGDMAIRMKEWGMLAPAPENVDRSGQKRAILDHIDIAQARGNSLRHLGEGIATYTQGESEREERRKKCEEEELLNQVQSTGELTELMNQLQYASTRAAAEMEDISAGDDFDYAWRERATPHYREALAELSPASREAGQKLADIYSQRDEIQVRQQKKLSLIDRARSLWNSSLQRSVSEGDEATAALKIDSAANIFIPQQDIDKAKQTAASAANFSRWNKEFKTAPIQTLARYKKAAGDQLPYNKDHRDSLATLSRDTELGARSALVQQLSRQLLANQEITEAELQSSLDAGLISKDQLRHITSQHTRLPRRQENLDYSQWQEQVDACPSDEQALLQLKLGIASSPLNKQNKKKLLLRVESNAELSDSSRQEMHRSIVNAYKAGAFGTPGDPNALARLCQLRDLAPSRIKNEGLKAFDDFISDHSLPEPVWVCHSDQSPTSHS